MSRNPWKTISSRTAYENPWIRVREDRVQRPDGGPGLYGVVEIRPSIGVVAINEKDEIALVGQWRYTVNRYLWEIPRGGSDPGQTDMLAVAQRELAEEAGVSADHWESLGEVEVCVGVTNDIQSLFLATGLHPVESHQDPEEELVTVWKPFADALAMVMRGELTEVCSVAAILKVAMLRHSDLR